jgi:integrase
MASGSIKEQADGRYTVRWRTPDGRQPRRTFTNRRSAERFLRQTLTDIEQHGITGAARGETLDTILDAWWANVQPSVRPRTIEKYQRNKTILSERYGHLPLDRVDYAQVQAIVTGLAARYQPRGVHSIYGVLALALKDAALHGKIRPIPKPKLPKVEDPDLVIPTRAEVEALADAVDERMRAMVLVAGYCGLREGELLGLERRNLRLDEQRVWVAAAVNKSTGHLEPAKTRGSKRWVVLPRRAHEALTGHVSEVETGERVFPLSGSTAQKTWERARKACRLERVRFHDLRHAAASMMIAANWNIMQVSRQLGHSKPSMTLNTYGFLYPESFDDALTKLDAYLDHDASV